MLCYIVLHYLIRHTDTQTNRHTGTQTGRHTATHKHRHTDTPTHSHTNTHILFVSCGFPACFLLLSGFAFLFFEFVYCCTTCQPSKNCFVRLPEVVVVGLVFWCSPGDCVCLFSFLCFLIFCLVLQFFVVCRVFFVFLASTFEKFVFVVLYCIVVYGSHELYYTIS